MIWEDTALFFIYKKIKFRRHTIYHPRRPRGGWLRREEINWAGSRRRFTSKAERAPGNRLLSDHFQTALPMLPPDWAEKSFVLFCPIGEQQLLRYCGVFVHDGFRFAILASFTNVLLCEGNFHFNFPRYGRNIEMRT